MVCTYNGGEILKHCLAACLADARAAGASNAGLATVGHSNNTSCFPDVVITMGCGDTCPVLPGKRYLDWELEDPAGKGVEEVRPVRDDIERRVRGLLAELGVA